MTTATNHTPATLRALYDCNPRELDALAHETVIGRRVIDTKVNPRSEALMSYYEDDIASVPFYSASLDAAALLEQRLAERGLDENYAEIMFNAQFPRHTGDIYEHRLFPLIHADAKSRTIAAILAAQEAK